MQEALQQTEVACLLDKRSGFAKVLRCTVLHPLCAIIRSSYEAVTYRIEGSAYRVPIIAEQCDSDMTCLQTNICR